ncbi:autoinducer binding domain-containing protein [Sphingobium phenoxybenzoativorans]|uniref:autoinducer binding domain-containing protein n=1 Tax=Sphingobium phenoxybenzoativorans TaxID=1592790 RepID=UPI00209B1626|nr:autoinducer binding domain-containing protein [Sphingobium phenoxybenzoativorans]
MIRYPAAITDRLIGQGLCRRDPIVRGCTLAENAFLWFQHLRPRSMPRFAPAKGRER